MSNRISAIEKRLSKLEAIEEIKKNLVRYTETLDEYDLDGHASLFTEDVKYSIPLWGLNISGRKKLREHLDDVANNLIYRKHNMTNAIIEVDRSSASTYGYAIIEATQKNGVYLQITIGIDLKWSKTVQGWKISNLFIEIFSWKRNVHPGIMPFKAF